MSTPQVPFLRRALGRPRITVPAVILVLELIASFGASRLAPYPPQQADFTAALSGPSAKHLLGTDRLGRDVLSRLMYGGADTFREIAIAVLITLVTAVPLGLVAGLRRGRIDAVLMRMADVVMSIPGIILLLIVLALFSQSMTAAMIVIGLLSVPGMMRVVRSASLTVGRETYVAAARVSGLGTWRVARRHVLPRITGLILVNAALACANTLLIAAGLNAIGLGVKPPAPSWGGMMADAAQTLNQSLWLAIPTGGLVAVTAAALIVLGDGLRDTLAERWSGTSHAPTTRRRKEVTAAAAAATAPESDDAWLLSEPDPVVRLTKVTVTAETEHGEVELISDVGLTVGQGRTVGLVGESGSGKSTLGRAVLGLTAVTQGTILFDGEDITHAAGARRRELSKSVQAVFQDPNGSLNPALTVGQTLAEPLLAHSRDERSVVQQRVREVLELVGLPAEAADRYPRQFSGGQRQRIAIARALVMAPKLIVCDEPVSALDLSVQAQVLNLFTDLQRETGVSYLFISHDLAVVRHLAQRIVVLYRGDVVEHGTTEEVYADAQHPYTRKLLAAAGVQTPAPVTP